MGTDILTEIRAAGITLSVDGGSLVATPKAAITDELRSLIRAHKPAILAALAHPDHLPPLPPAAASRRQKVLALLARGGGQYAVLVEDPNTDPVVMALATPDGTCDVLIPRDRYDPFAVLAIVKGWEREAAEPDPLWWRVSITEPGGRRVEVDAPSGWTLPDWQAYADRYHGPGCAVTPIAGLPQASGPVPLDEVLRAACERVGGITPAQFRSLLSPEDVAEIAAGGIHCKTLHAYAQSFAEGIRSGRIAVLPEGTPMTTETAKAPEPVPRYPSGTVVMSFYGDGAPLEEVRVTHPWAVVEPSRSDMKVSAALFVKPRERRPGLARLAPSTQGQNKLYKPLI